VHAPTARLQRLAHARPEPVHTWRLQPAVEALQALRGVPCPGAGTIVAARGELTRVDHPRPRRRDWGLPPSADARGARRRQRSRTKTGNTHARRALVEGAWAYRYPANVRRHRQLRLEKRPQAVQEISWKAHVRLCTRPRKRSARGKHAHPVGVAIARELIAFLWAIAHEVPMIP
jgi:transposase